MSEIARAASRMESAAANTTRAADRMEEAASRIAHLFEDGYGGNGVRLIELMEGSNELQATRDMLDSARSDLEVMRNALGVPAEPHQSLIERMVEAAQAKRGAVPEGDDGKRVLREVFALCEDTEAKCHEDPSDFNRGRSFEAKGIARAIGAWYQEEFCGRTHMGEPVAPDQFRDATKMMAAPAGVSMPKPVAYGFGNTAITGHTNRLMMVRIDIPGGDQYAGAFWLPLVLADEAHTYGVACRAAGEAAGYARGLRDAVRDADIEALRLYVRALCKAVDAATDFAGTVAGGASWWDDVWADHAAALDRARERISQAALRGEVKP